MANTECILVLPDSQNGFRGSEPLHDRKAWEAAILLSTLVNPKQVVLLGDMLDFSTLTKKFRKHADLMGKMKPTIEETRWWLRRLMETVPSGEFIEGNHEARFRNTLCDASEDLEEIVTVEEILHLSDLNIRYHGPYGQGYSYKGVDYIHGDKYAKFGGATSAKYLAEHPNSVVFGHCHKAEYGMRRYKGINRFAACPGTLARCDGLVPGNSPNPDWQEGLGIVHYSKNGSSWYEQVNIENGNMFFRGDVFPIKHDARKRMKELGF